MRSFDEEKFVTMYNAGVAIDKIAKTFRISTHTVREYAKEHPDTCNKTLRQQSKSYDNETLVKMWNADVPTKKIAKTIGVAESTVRYYAKNHPELCKTRGKLRKKTYTTEDIVKLRAKGRTAKEIADTLGISVSAVNGQISYYTDRFDKKYSNYDSKKLIKLWKHGVSSVIIAKELGVSRDTITSFVSLHRQECGRRATKYSILKLCDMHKSGMTEKKIAKEVGISKEAVVYFLQKYEDRYTKSYDEEDAKIIALWNKNYTYLEIASELRIEPSKVLSSLARNEDKRIKKRNTYNPDDIVKLWGENVPVAEIAKKLGIAKTAVYKFASKHRDVCPRRT